METEQDMPEAGECARCGDENADLKPAATNYVHDCPEHQKADPNPEPMCKTCRNKFHPKAGFVAQRRASKMTFVLYDCGITKTPLDLAGQPGIQLRCDCGAKIDQILYGSDGGTR